MRAMPICATPGNWVERPSKCAGSGIEGTHDAGGCIGTIALSHRRAYYNDIADDGWRRSHGQVSCRGIAALYAAASLEVYSAAMAELLTRSAARAIESHESRVYGGEENARRTFRA
jgi:hypothetical protein